MKTFQVLVLIFVLTLNVAYAGEEDVLQVKVKRTGDNVYYLEDPRFLTVHTGYVPIFSTIPQNTSSCRH